MIQQRIQLKLKQAVSPVLAFIMAVSLLVGCTGGTTPPTVGQQTPNPEQKTTRGFARRRRTRFFLFYG
ncbi:hypothetical protein LQV63_11930 [Paenibacillus profundus]|uniref:Uncharacterized protein n=1 Tax=Paenibacillus profundus TaxID=1173085 RepID=A0ABS8YKE0_9BACL|nr:hypothetical protein [Paenibacillus profundus]